MPTLLYVRVGATDQPAEAQITQARAAGFSFDDVLVDEGVSSLGTSLKRRPEGKQLFDRLGHGDTLVVRWLDHLGRNPPNIIRTIQNFLDKGVTIRTVIGDIALYGSPSSSLQTMATDTLVAYLNAAADAYAEIFEEVHRTGLGRAKGGKNVSPGRKPSYDRKTFELVVNMLAEGAMLVTIVEATGLSRTVISRIKRDPHSARKTLERWEEMSKAKD